MAYLKLLDEQIFNYYKWLGYKDFFTLLFGQMLYAFHKRVPKELFTSKTVFDYVQEKKGRVIRSADSIKIEIDELKWILRKKGSDIKVFEQLIVAGDGFSKVLELITA